MVATEVADVVFDVLRRCPLYWLLLFSSSAIFLSRLQKSDVQTYGTVRVLHGIGARVTAYEGRKSTWDAAAQDQRNKSDCGSALMKDWYSTHITAMWRVTTKSIASNPR